MRRAWLRGRENLQKRYLVHAAGYNLGLIMRLLFGAGTPREFVTQIWACLLLLMTADGAKVVILVVVGDNKTAMLAIAFQLNPSR